jgi:hypothetical protein
MASPFCSVPHREDLHRRPYQYAVQFLTGDEARRIEGDLAAAGALEEAPALRAFLLKNAVSHRVR